MAWGKQVYKVRLYTLEGKGFIEGYETARQAKRVVDRVNDQFNRDPKDQKGFMAEYLGREK